MSGFYSPFDAHPGQQWSNLIPLRAPTHTEQTGERCLLPALPVAPNSPAMASGRLRASTSSEPHGMEGSGGDSVERHATNSPKPIQVIPVRCKCQPNAFRIRIPAKPQAKAAPRQGNSREQFKRVLRCLAAPALSRRGDRHADMNLFGPFKVARYLLSLVQACKQASGCVTQTLKMFLRLFAHVEQITMEPKACRTQTKGIRNP